MVGRLYHHKDVISGQMDLYMTLLLNLSAFSILVHIFKVKSNLDKYNA